MSACVTRSQSLCKVLHYFLPLFQREFHVDCINPRWFVKPWIIICHDEQVKTWTDVWLGAAFITKLIFNVTEVTHPCILFECVIVFFKILFICLSIHNKIGNYIIPHNLLCFNDYDKSFTHHLSIKANNLCMCVSFISWELLIPYFRLDGCIVGDPRACRVVQFGHTWYYVWY